MPTTRRTKGAVLAPVYDDPMPRKQRSRATSVASSQRSNDRSHDPGPSLNALSRLTSHNEELTAENDGLREELERQKAKRWTLRDKQLALQLAEHREQSTEPEHAPSQQTPVTKAAKQTAKTTTPARLPISPTHADSSPTLPPPHSSPIETVAAATQISTPTSVPRWRQFLSSFTGFTPFSARKPREPATEPAKQQQHLLPPSSPLGPLPDNRKRSAPPAEPEEAEDAETDSPVKRSRTPDRDHRSQSARKAPTSASRQHLETISEQSEPNQQKHKRPLRKQAAPPTTPTRSTRRKAAQTAPHTEKITRTEMLPQTSTPKRRTIKDTRQSRDTRTAAPSESARVLKRWEAPQKPKEPNADKRLARMQQLEKLRAEKIEMEKEIARLAAEQEADGIDTRKRKRVKVDELAFIPHNQPGDAVGTFRVPDWDSDDEMEVDEAVPVKKNVFAANAENQRTLESNKLAPQPSPTKSKASLQPQPVPPQPAQAPAVSTLPPPSLFKPAVPSQLQQSISTEPAAPEPLFKAQPAKPAQSSTQPLPVVPAAKTSSTSATAKAKIAWPSVGRRAMHDDWTAQQKVAAGQKFARGFDTWLSVGLQAH